MLLSLPLLVMPQNPCMWRTLMLVSNVERRCLTNSTKSTCIPEHISWLLQSEMLNKLPLCGLFFFLLYFILKSIYLIYLLSLYFILYFLFASTVSVYVHVCKQTMLCESMKRFLSLRFGPKTVTLFPLLVT